jgi:glutamyl-tRNA synthetase/nondiscriminating glutamyl-tRNA synthetase
MKESPPGRLAELSVPFLARAGYLAEPVDATVLAWLERVLDAVLKNLDNLSQLPAAAKMIFEYDSARVVSNEETRHVMDDAAAREVLQAFIPKVLAESNLTYERFREIAKSVQKETGKKGKELFHPIRVAVTGAVSGPELEKLIPIFEEGSKLPLARHVKSTAERLREFAQAAKL